MIIFSIGTAVSSSNEFYHNLFQLSYIIFFTRCDVFFVVTVAAQFVYAFCCGVMLFPHVLD